MFLEILPYLFCIAIALLGTIVYRRLSRSTKITKDKVAGITVAVTLIPCSLTFLVMVLLQEDAHFDWILVIIAVLPVISYFLVTIWYRWFILPQLELIEKTKKNKK